jgi:hypothetical protein
LIFLRKLHFLHHTELTIWPSLLLISILLLITIRLTIRDPEEQVGLLLLGPGDLNVALSWRKRCGGLLSLAAFVLGLLSLSSTVILVVTTVLAYVSITVFSSTSLSSSASVCHSLVLIAIVKTTHLLRSVVAIDMSQLFAQAAGRRRRRNSLAEDILRMAIVTIRAATAAVRTVVAGSVNLAGSRVFVGRRLIVYDGLFLLAPVLVLAGRLVGGLVGRNIAFGVDFAGRGIFVRGVVVVYEGRRLAGYRPWLAGSRNALVSQLGVAVVADRLATAAFMTAVPLVTSVLAAVGFVLRGRLIV